MKDCTNKTGENMMCVTCGKIHCGRSKSKHAIAHNKDSDHPITVGISDLSIWCYKCESYIT
eukprot:UN06225